MKSLISSDTFWNDLGKIQNFLENFAIFIKKLGDETFLSTAYLEYQQLKAHVRNNTDLPENIREEVEKFGTNRWQNFLYNPVVIVAYKLDPRYCGSQLNARIFDPIIEKEILSLVGEEYKDIVLTELAEYVGKTGSFAHSNLWGDVIQNPVNWWNLMKGRYPILSDIAIQILSIPATSAASERNWSTFGFIHSKLRNKLHEKRVEKLFICFGICGYYVH
uniref:HAT C-terminal dimerisation domain-containing protein n=1 Tax=Rhizophagus irregularis (strain DAOM 181602 / DAOM 197198 / MUCL 43194) TaxID=747089 RepID=U9TXR5_RHIID